MQEKSYLVSGEEAVCMKQERGWIRFYRAAKKV